MTASARKIWKFRERLYEVSLEVEDDRMVVQVQDETTTDQWRGSFEARHIEELTHKTGNFKQFKVFVNMLQSSINKASDSVSLELLTYSDLENLRHRKSAYSKSHSANDSSHVSAKRYLILTYSAEFDRIHYPLALPYIGKSDPIKLQEIIRQLKKELDFYKKQTTLKHQSSNDSKLQRKYDVLLQDKENLESAYVALQEDMELRMSEEGRGKDIKSLKKIIKNLEENSLKEKTKHQRIIGKKNEEIKILMEELEELRTSERLLTTRVKNLTNEISMLKRNPSSYRHHTRSGSGGQINTPSRGYLRRRSSSAERNISNQMGSQRNVLPVTGRSRYRSSSAEGRINNRSGLDTRSGSRPQRSSSTERHFGKSRAPSPKGSAVFKRFDPTSYVLNKKKRQEEIDRKLNRQRSRSNSRERVCLSNRSSPSLIGNSRRIYLGTAKASSIGSQSSCGSSAECSGDEEVLSNHRRKKNNSKPHRIINSQMASSTPVTQKKLQRKMQQNDSSLNLDHSLEIHEIDARLNALQQFMKKSLDCVRNAR